MMKINPTIVNEVADEMLRRYSEGLNQYDIIVECIRQLRQMKGLDAQIHALENTAEILHTEIEQSKRYADVLVEVTDLYLGSDQRAIARAEGNQVVTKKITHLVELTVPSYETGIVF
ncbi:MAG: hypothetical protein IKI20_03430 [Lachnospiraceae bacterium]|nr:hypothetical protein [Lachnospiraceae bacterium]